MNIDKRALREVAEKATKGEWWSDVVDTDGEYGEGEDRVSGYHSYAVYVGHESLLDMINSTAACIHTEWDHDYHMAWDETAKRNAEFIAAANPDTVLALLDENIQLLREKDAIEAVALALRDDMRDVREKLEAAERRIAELDSCTVTVKLPNGDRDIAAFRIDPTEGPSWLTFRCEEDLRENGVIGEFDSVVPLSVITSDVPKRGEVVVTVSGLTGSGKSAIAGEIEIAMRAIGVPVHWMNGGAEKRMTEADWLTAIEMYKPTVRIVEVNVPRAAGIGKGK
ncbi:ead/Ea22-like family protein [Salmonella enterica subsp. enterica serovar Uganda]|nr:ead/Ea22-like family protein [Salmonella enterica subsp. enterica serovar Uganda]ECZ9570042.1 ead/Ea22-like family protein [Salmonella enterica subsp. enterica serovar Uganda]